MTVRTEIVRPLRPEDADAAASLLRGLEESVGYRASATTAEVREWWGRADLETSSWAYEQEGRLCGFGWVEQRGDAGAYGVQFAPDVWSEELTRDLIERSEARIRELGLQRAQVDALARDVRLRALYEACGYRFARTFHLMSVELLHAPREPRAPEGIVLDAFRESDARAVFDTFAEAFADEWGFSSSPYEEWYERRVANADTRFYFVARAGSEIVGALRGQTEWRGGGFVGMLGVRRAWRGRGIGEALLRHAFKAWYDSGEQRVLLAVDSENRSGAMRLYERVGMRVELENVIYEKELT